MPHVRINRTAGARREVTYLGVSQQGGAEANDRRATRARREKQALIREVKRLIAPGAETDWKAASEQMRRVHMRWKRVPSAGRERDERLYRSFKKVCEGFQRQRREHFAALTRRNRSNAAVKEQLITEAQSLSEISDHDDGKRQFADLISRWRAAGPAGARERGLWEQFVAARQAMYEATEPDRRVRESQYLGRVEARIQRHRESIGKLGALRRELVLRRQQVIPGWVGGELIEEFDERIEGIDEDIAARELWLAEDMRRAARVADRL
ncbi:MAG TPA: DUF349 domain-containing protein [Solirubrobacteraceae bacterium]|jgi:hypothetical protein